MATRCTARTCPCCLGSFELNGSNLVRHGWNAYDIQHGSTGGWHTAPCEGTGAPMFESPEGLAWAKGYHPRLVALVATLTELLARAKADLVAFERENDAALVEAEAAYRHTDEQRALRAQHGDLVATVSRRKAQYAEAVRWEAAHQAAIDAWVEGEAPAPKTRQYRDEDVVHVVGGCRIKTGKRVTDDGEVTCEHCLDILAKTAEARKRLATFDAAIEVLAGMVKTSGKLYDALTAAQNKARGKFAKALTAEQIEAVKTTDRYAADGRLVYNFWCRAVDTASKRLVTRTYEVIDSEGTKFTKRSKDVIAAALVIGCTRSRKAAIQAKPYEERTEAEQDEFFTARSARYFATVEAAKAALAKTKGYNPEVVEVTAPEL